MKREKSSRTSVIKKNKILLALVAVVLAAAVYLLFFAEYSADSIATTKNTNGNNTPPGTIMRSFKKGFSTVDKYMPRLLEPAMTKSLVLQNEENKKVTVKVSLKGVECRQRDTAAKKIGGCLFEYKPTPDTMTYNLDSTDTGEIKLDFDVYRVDAVWKTRMFKTKSALASEFILAKKIDNKIIRISSITISTLDGKKITKKNIRFPLEQIKPNFSNKESILSKIPSSVQKFQISKTSPIKFKPISVPNGITPASTGK